ncbi:NAD(P)/FAD-dependent oxidoreductase [Belnapia mucosa]|uniref:NAD(P)/FAD-dependent oxidoreductase n=1 Tax=Belnapia mucosa TaxID=2804532 RepID=UPI002E2D0DA0|nr:NAD(P)/FAD-dependent oxidoreductase [Belnapia mucosa]
MRRRALLGAALLAAPALAQAAPKVVVIGGGFGGATAARALHRLGVAVTLVERDATYLSCPFSNAVIAGLREMEAQRFGYDGLRREGIAVVLQAARTVEARQVVLADGATLPFDRLVMAPGIALRPDAIPGLDTEVMPHAWRAGPQTLLLRRQLEAMEDGGLVVLSAPANPYRCPPGPYERASLIAHHLKTRKPRSKLILLDAKDTFSKQKLFEEAWAALYPGLLEWVPLSSGGKVVEVDAAARVVRTEFGEHQAAVANIIPPQSAGRIAQAAGLTDRSGWCPVDPVSFESRQRAGVHLIGDAIIAGAMPKSAFAANAQARVCAEAVAALLRGEAPAPPKLINTCYSLVEPGYGISIAGVYQPANGLLADVPGAGGVSALGAPAATRAAEAGYAEDWFRTVTADAFG